MKNKLIKLILGLVSIVLILIIIMMCSTQLPGITGQVDTEYPTLFVSGAPISQLIILKWAGLLFGLCVVSIFLASVAIGAQRKNNSSQKEFLKRIIIGSVLYIGVYLWMVISWWDYTKDNPFDYVFGLPVPTAVMMFGLLFTPAFLSYFYIVKFDSWVYSEEDEIEFQQILQRRKSRNQ